MLDQNSGLLSFLAVSGKKQTHLYNWLKHYGLLVKSSSLSVSVNKVLLAHSHT